MCDDGLLTDLPDAQKFFNDPFIKSIAGVERWSVSDKNKRPVDMHTLEFDGVVRGCDPDVPFSMCSLFDTVRVVRFPANHAFYLRCAADGFLVLDVESSCPTPLKLQFLDLPYLYAEKSLSGKGLHLIMPKPSCFDDFPHVCGKPKMQEEHRWYEILMNHWVTFTRNMLPRSRGGRSLDDWDALFKSLAEVQVKPRDRCDFELQGFDVSDIPCSDVIVSLLSRSDANLYGKTPEDFYDDLSRFEFGLLSFKYRKLRSLLASSMIAGNGHEYSLDEKARLLFRIGELTVPYRDKHDEKRNGLPWLMYMAYKIVSQED